jgi:hypothetical protein
MAIDDRDPAAQNAIEISAPLVSQDPNKVKGRALRFEINTTPILDVGPAAPRCRAGHSERAPVPQTPKAWMENQRPPSNPGDPNCPNVVTVQPDDFRPTRLLARQCGQLLTTHGEEPGHNGDGHYE